MELYDYLETTYGKNAPIQISSIQYKTYSQPWIAKEIKSLCDIGKVKRYEKGIYYIPTKTLFGPSTLTPQSVISAKYLRRDGKTIGYYSGYTLLNSIGFTTQVPRIAEVCTNNESSIGREVTIGESAKVFLRCPKQEINNENVWSLALMDMMAITDYKEYTDNKRTVMKSFIKEKGITQKSISEVAVLYSGQAVKTLIGSGVMMLAPAQ